MPKLKKMFDIQFLYKGKWVNRFSFRSYLYSKENEKRLVNSYEEYDKLMKTKEWFNEPQQVVIKKVVKKRNKNNGDANS